MKPKRRAPSSKPAESAAHRFHGLRRHFTTAARDPFESVEWEHRDCEIRGGDGKIIFSQTNVEAPATWSQMALNVVASKYFTGELGTMQRESSVRALIRRVVNQLTEWGNQQGYFRSTGEMQIFSDELTYLLLHQYGSFNSPVWFNVGVVPEPQCSACFILPVDDSMTSLLELQKIEGQLFKGGSGTGTNLSTIRSSREKLAGGGRASGPVSFMRGYDAWAASIKSGGKTRRAAKMQILDVTHPDIAEFIHCKANEEKKAHALIEAGFDGGFDVPGGAYDSVAFQNSNLSIRVSDEFMRAAETNGTYDTRYILDGSVCEKLPAREILKEAAEAAYVCGDPGIQFDTTINLWHTCPNSGRINASNPCSEYMHLDNSACNLASVNLLKFLLADDSFDVPAFQQVVDILVTAQDIVVEKAGYPTPAIRGNAKRFRQLGLGYANLGALLMSSGLPYDSDEGRRRASAITALLTGQAYKRSAELARDLGPFAGFADNRDAMLAVIDRHAAALADLAPGEGEGEIFEGAALAWREARSVGSASGFRNSQVTVLAPTGTIAFMMDCDTTGIEPDIALVKYKKLAGGGVLKLVNKSVPRALHRLGYGEKESAALLAYVNEHDTIEGAPGLNPAHLAVFDCAFRPASGERSIHYRGHLGMMAAVQPFISGAISKTVNLPAETSASEIQEIYMEAWRAGLKAVALYRDGSKKTQPLTLKEMEQLGEDFRPLRRRLPDEREAVTHKFSVGGLEGYLTVGLYEDKTPGEIFLVVAKEGSTLSGVLDAFATAVSLALQYGVPLAALVRKFIFLRFEPEGFTNNREIPMAQSVIDYVFRWLALKFLDSETCLELGIQRATQDPAGAQNPRAGLPITFRNAEDSPPCLRCGSTLMVRQAGCYYCLNCGSQGSCG